MNAVFRHEVSSHFHSLSAYVFGAFLLLFGGVYTMVMNLNNLLTNFEFVMGNMAFIFLIIVPILTMRVLAEERRQKTDQLLYSLPISMTDVVLGKFGALLVMLLIPLAIIALYPVVLSAFGNIHFPTAYGAMLGFFLLGAALIAIGLFISSITESQAVAAGLCFVVMLLNYYISDLATFVAATAFASFSAFAAVIVILALLINMMTKNGTISLIFAAVGEGALLAGYLLNASSFEGLFPKVMESLSLFDRFYVFVNGVFDLSAVVYFITVIALFLFLSVQSMERRRWND
ncbi:MAG: ABC transporter permease subunit [Oscillospiraceae bacterium]|nr:ABC transporter permease subunit [Oscillospiraceae bacterium]